MIESIRLLENETIIKGLRFPHKIDQVTQVIITAGKFSCLVNFRHYTLEAPAMAIFLPGQVIERLEIDESFAGVGMIMSSEFTDSMNLPVSLKERLFIKNTQFYSISKEVIDAYMTVIVRWRASSGRRTTPIVSRLSSICFQPITTVLDTMCTALRRSQPR